MESELSYNTPIFSKDVEYTECEYCFGDGWIYLEYDPNNTKDTCTCPACHGTGNMPIEND